MYGHQYYGNAGVYLNDIPYICHRCGVLIRSC